MYRLLLVFINIQLTKTDEATRVSGRGVLNRLAEFIPNLICGSADLADSTGCKIKDGGYFSAQNPDGSATQRQATFLNWYAKSDGITLETKNLTSQDYYVLGAFMSNWYKPSETTLKDLIEPGDKGFFKDFSSAMGKPGDAQLKSVVKQIGEDTKKGIDSGSCTLLLSNGTQVMSGYFFLKAMRDSISQSDLSLDNTNAKYFSWLGYSYYKIKDYDKATIVGTKTCGKGIIQTFFTLSDGSGLKITTAEYYTPKGSTIHEIGVTPNEIAELPKDIDNIYAVSEEKDTQLKKAIRILSK